MEKWGKFSKISCFLKKCDFLKKKKIVHFFQNRAQKNVKSSQILQDTSLGLYLQNCFLGFLIFWFFAILWLFLVTPTPKIAKIMIFGTLRSHKMGKIEKIKNPRKQFCRNYWFNCVYQFLGLFEHFWAQFWKKMQFFSSIFPLGNNKGFRFCEKVGVTFSVITFEPFLFRSWLTTHFEEEG